MRQSKNLYPTVKIRWVVVLIEPSDVGVSAKVDDIMTALKETWSIPLGHGCKVLAVTVPRAKFDKNFPPLVQRRNELNQEIKDSKADGLYVLQMAELLPGQMLINAICTATYLTYTTPCHATRTTFNYGTMPYISSQQGMTSLAI